MHISEIGYRKNSIHTNLVSHKSQKQLKVTSSNFKCRQTQIKIRKRSLKLKNINLIQESNDFCRQKSSSNFRKSSYQLNFISDIIRKKKEQIDIRKTQEVNSITNLRDYEYYDIIVRDIISEMKNRKVNKGALSPPYKYKPMINNKSKDKQKLTFASIKLQPSKQKMTFSMNLNGTDLVYQRKITSFVQFIYKLNFANQMYINLSLSSPKLTYKVKVGSGNNSLLIKSLLKRRFWVQFTKQSDYHFIWTQSTDQNVHQSQQKAKRQIQPIKYKAPKRLKVLCNSPLEHQLKIMRKQQMSIANDWYQKSDCGKNSYFNQEQISKVSNHLPINCIIGAKRILFKVMSWYYINILNVDPFSILPKTYNFQNNPSSTNIRGFVQKHRSVSKVWIVKPGQNSNRGRGIKIAQTQQLIRLLQRQCSKGSEMKPLIVQQYIKPFLYCHRKFDIRHYLLLTSHNGFIRAYWYKQGYIRTSSEKYDIDDMDEMIHLTNDAVQKKGQNYGKYQEANKISYSQFQRYLDTTHPHKHYDFQTQILQKMKQITINLMKASFQFIDPLRKKHNFELYGLDFYISNKFKPYLIECNANPCLEINCPILERIIPGAVDHALRLGFDPLFPPPCHYPPADRYKLCDKIMQKLKYQLIFDEKVEGQQIIQKTKECSEKLILDSNSLVPEQDIFQDDGQQLLQTSGLD